MLPSASRVGSDIWGLVFIQVGDSFLGQDLSSELIFGEVDRALGWLGGLLPLDTSASHISFFS